MKIANFLAFLVVAGVSLAVGYFVGSDIQGISKLMGGDAAVVAPDPADKVLATVDGSEIRESEVKRMYETLPPEYKQSPYILLKAQLVEQLVNMRIVLNAAIVEKIDTQPEYMSELAETKKQALQGYYIRKKIEAGVTGEALNAEYANQIKDFKAEKEVHARHILLKEEQEAIDVIGKLDAGGDFVELAKEFSTGPSKATGGDLGFFVKARMVPEFAEAAFALEKGAYTKAPVKTQFGWHVILTEETRETQPPLFETLEKQINSTVTNKVVTDLLEKLKAAATVSIVKPEGETPVEDKKEEPKKEG